MTKKCTLIFGLALTLGLSIFAQEKPSTPAPAKPKTKKAKAAAKHEKAAAEKDETPLSFSPIGTAVATQENVNVRGKASFRGEVVAKLKKGDTVTLLEEITLKQPQKDEPTNWFRIALPPKTPVWAFAEYVNLDSKTVVPKKLNLRSGPGENFSVVGYLKKGDAIKVVSTKTDWVQLEAPENCFAFVAAQFLEKQAPAPTPAPAPAPVQPTPPAEVTTVTQAQTPKPADAAPVETPKPAEPAPAVQAQPPVVATNESTPAVAPRRIVKREGFVRYTVSIQAPTMFEIESVDTKRLINYLYSPADELEPKKPKFNILKFLNQKVIVTGEEFMDKRWKTVPVLQIETIEPATP